LQVIGPALPVNQRRPRGFPASRYAVAKRHDFEVFAAVKLCACLKQELSL
jgi:hypothetical protein